MANVWNLYAPLYELAMHPDRAIYQRMYGLVAHVATGGDVLELACGPGMIARNIASAARSVVATDFSPRMIEQARRAGAPGNVRFEVADATDLPYPDGNFDVVVIANALHVMPDPQLALAEIARVLKPQGTLVAPNFVDHGARAGSGLWTHALEALGIRFKNKWDGEKYLSFLRGQGWEPTFTTTLRARMTLLYVECKRVSST